MKVSYNWLKEYIELDQIPAELAEILTGLGLEVTGYEKTETIKGGMKGLIIGQVLTCEPHPDSDHLSKTTVSIGSDHVLPVICGAPNVAAGQKIILATAGTILYDGDKEFHIKKTKIRGEVSEGMICSEIEIGMGKDASGIMVLPENAPVGTAARDFFKIEDDYIFEIDLTPNRIDSASHIGIARDLAAYLSQKYEISYHKPSVDQFRIDNHELEIPVTIKNPEACPRYTGVTISGVTVKESPVWLQNRLKSVGLIPINNVVDVTNFVLYETGHPLHAFDAGEITSGRVVVRKLAAGTEFCTLDEVKRILHEDDLCICDDDEPMCIGGIFGGIKSGIKIATKNVFLESACFDPVHIRKTARRHGLNTDASFRFERGIDPNGVLYSLKRAALLIKEIAGGEISSGIIDEYPDPIGHCRVDILYSNISRLIGKDLGNITIKNILRALEIEVAEENEKKLTVLVPPYRVDVQREADVIEEILRIYGYNNVEIPNQVRSSLQYSGSPDPGQVKNTISDLLAGQGFNEIWSNSLTKADYYDNLESYTGERTVMLFNPLSVDLNGMRQTLIFGGLECIAYNINRQNPDLKLFEFGNCYFYKGSHLKENPLDNYLEEEHLALFITGSRETKNWTNAKAPVSFFLIKKYAENILSRLGFDLKLFSVNETSLELLSDGLTYSLYNIKVLDIGIVARSILKKTNVANPVYYADFNWNVLLTEHRRFKNAFTELPRYPEVSRDLALILDKKIKFNQIRSIAFKTERSILQAVDLFDVYEGKGIPEGKKSYALNFVLRDDKQTLNDKQIDKVMQRLVESFERQTGAILRGPETA